VTRTASDARCDFPIVGESRFQDALSTICGGHNWAGQHFYTRARIVPEPTNPHDPNAVRVEIQGRPVGYLGRDHAAKYVKRLAEEGRSAEVVEVCAYINGGWRTNQHDQGSLEKPWPLKRRATHRKLSGQFTLSGARLRELRSAFVPSGAAVCPQRRGRVSTNTHLRSLSAERHGATRAAIFA
jgi:hypothetical protein